MNYSSIGNEFAAALVRVQGSIEGAIKDTRNDFFKSKYADLASCWDACREALQKNSIAVLQFPSQAKDGHIALTTHLVHGPTGDVMSGTFELPMKDPTNAQAGGSAITYARRYALCSIIGICPEDDDGNAASAPKKGSANSSKATVQTTEDVSGKHEAGYRARFVTSSNLDDRKRIYGELKMSSVQEPNKTELLKFMADKITAEKNAMISSGDYK